MIVGRGDIDILTLSEGIGMTQISKCGGARWRMLLALAVLATLVSMVAPQAAWAAPRTGVTLNARQAPDYPALDDPDPDVRAEAVQAIRKAKEADAVPALVAHIEDPDERVGLYIAQALAELAPPDVVPVLLAPLLRSDASGRWRAAYVLGERKEPRSVSVLARALRDDEVLVSRTAAEALSKDRHPRGHRRVDRLADERAARRSPRSHERPARPGRCRRAGPGRGAGLG